MSHCRREGRPRGIDSDRLGAGAGVEARQEAAATAEVEDPAAMAALCRLPEVTQAQRAHDVVPPHGVHLMQGGDLNQFGVINQ